MKKLLVIISFLILSIGTALAGPLEDFAEEYKQGTALVQQGDYKTLYSKSSDREIRFSNQQVFEGRIDCYYVTTMLFEGEEYKQEGVASFYLEDEKVVRVEYARIAEGSYLDVAMAGQVADIASTATALSMGFVEGNAIVAGAISTPAGAVAMAGVKLGMVVYADQQGLAECVQTRAVLGSFGWGAAAWNTSLVLAANPVVAMAIGIGVAIYAWDKTEEGAPTECIERVE